VPHLGAVCGSCTVLKLFYNFLRKKTMEAGKSWLPKKTKIRQKLDHHDPPQRQTQP
jgi:hypothetical protein